MTSYILGESQGETQRLMAQVERDPVESRLIWAGLAPGMHAVDAGCGPGETSRALARLIGSGGSVRGYDISPARIEAARQRPPVEGSAPISFETGDVRSLPLSPGQADFVMCQYVLEYLPDAQRGVDALVRLLKPGGRLLLVDCDGIGTAFWPSSPELEKGVALLLQVLAKTGFDPFVGRKLYTMAIRAGLRDIQMTTYPYLLAAGNAGPAEDTAWRQRFQALTPFGLEAFGSEAAWNLFTSSYLAMLADMSSFKFILGVALCGSGP